MTVGNVNSVVKAKKSFGAEIVTPIKQELYTSTKPYKSDEFVKKSDLVPGTKTIIGCGAILLTGLGIIAFVKGKGTKGIKSFFKKTGNAFNGADRTVRKSAEELQNITNDYIKRNRTSVNFNIDANGNYFNFERIINGKIIRGVKDPKTGKIIGKVNITDMPKTNKSVITQRTKVFPSGAKVKEQYLNGEYNGTIETIYNPETRINMTRKYDYQKRLESISLRNTSNPEVELIIKPADKRPMSTGILNNGFEVIVKGKGTKSCAFSDLKEFDEMAKEAFGKGTIDLFRPVINHPGTLTINPHVAL